MDLAQGGVCHLKKMVLIHETIPDSNRSDGDCVRFLFLEDDV